MHVWAMLRGALHAAGLRDDLGTWVAVDPRDPAAGRVRACAYPRTDRALARLAACGVEVLVNLAERPHAPTRLARWGLREVHVPVPDLSAPSLAQVAAALEAVDRAHALGRGAAVHCDGGLGRTGTVVACYLVRTGCSADAAIARVRAVRPGAIETAAQQALVWAYAARCGAARRDC